MSDMLDAWRAKMAEGKSLDELMPSPPVPAPGVRCSDVHPEAGQCARTEGHDGLHSMEADAPDVRAPSFDGQYVDELESRLAAAERLLDEAAILLEDLQSENAPPIALARSAFQWRAKYDARLAGGR